MKLKNTALPSELLCPYTGGNIVTYGHYVYELCPKHPMANPWGYVPQHRLIVERALGRFLQSSELIHHKNGNKTDNRLDNLQVVSRAEHQAIHQQLKRLKSHDNMQYSVVKELLENHGIKYTAKHFGVVVETLRRHFPELTKNYVRRSPTQIDDPAAIETVKLYAPDNRFGLREVAKLTGISARTIRRICDKNGISWVKKSKVGECHSTYDKRTAQELIDSNPSLATKILEYALSTDKSMGDLCRDYPQLNYVYIQKILSYYSEKWVAKEGYQKTATQK